MGGGRGGAIGLINLSCATATSSRQRWAQVTGTIGAISFDYDGSEVILDTPEGKRSIPVEDRGNADQRILQEFRDYVLKGEEPEMTGEEGLKDLAFIMAAYQSAEQGASVALSPP